MKNPDISFRRVGVYAGKIDTKLKINLYNHIILLNFVLLNLG